MQLTRLKRRKMSQNWKKWQHKKHTSGSHHTIRWYSCYLARGIYSIWFFEFQCLHGVLVKCWVLNMIPSSTVPENIIIIINVWFCLEYNLPISVFMYIVHSSNWDVFKCGCACQGKRNSYVTCLSLSQTEDCFFFYFL